MMRWRSVWGLMIGVLLSACVSAPSPVSSPFDPREHARIRVFHLSSVLLYFGNVCEGEVSGFTELSAGGWSTFARKRKLGIPRTAKMRWPFYQEYVIPAGQALTLRAWLPPPDRTRPQPDCGPPSHIVFTPKAGGDYEVYMDIKGSDCHGIVVNQINLDGGIVQRQSLDHIGLPFSSCSDYSPR
ncbi:MAG TPA: hypothetical protein PLQ67_08155 [Burkholderiaceae bacterium]|nr:hypothetical protein [Burkholderiaceae bacterium]